jgi:hypothetical protein
LTKSGISGKASICYMLTLFSTFYLNHFSNSWIAVLTYTHTLYVVCTVKINPPLFISFLEQKISVMHKHKPENVQCKIVMNVFFYN